MYVYRGILEGKNNLGNARLVIPEGHNFTIKIIIINLTDGF